MVSGPIFNSTLGKMKKVLLPLGIAIAGVLICVGLLLWENNKLSKHIEDLENGTEPEEEKKEPIILLDNEPESAIQTV
jgi:hypothetical protein